MNKQSARKNFGPCDLCTTEKATRCAYVQQVNLLVCEECYGEVRKKNPIVPEKMYRKHGIKRSGIRKVYEQAIAEGNVVYRYYRLENEIMISVWTKPWNRGGRHLFNYPEEV